MFLEGGANDGWAAYAADLVEARTRWEAAGSVPGAFRSFLDSPPDPELCDLAHTPAAEYRVTEFWPWISGEHPFPSPGWMDGYTYTDHDVAAFAVELAFHDGIDPSSS